MKYSASAFFCSSAVEWLAKIERCIGRGTPSSKATPSKFPTVCRVAATASTVRVGSGEREREEHTSQWKDTSADYLCNFLMVEAFHWLNIIIIYHAIIIMRILLHSHYS